MTQQNRGWRESRTGGGPDTQSQFVIETEEGVRQVRKNDERDDWKPTTSAEMVTTGSGNQLAVVVDATDQCEENAMAPKATASILTGVYDDSGVVPVGVANESLDITVTRPDDTQEGYSVTTDQNGSASVAYDLSTADRGTGTYEVTVSDSTGTSVSTQWDVGVSVTSTSSWDKFVFAGDETQFEFLALEGTSGVEGIDLTLRLVDSATNTTVTETTTTTDSDGFAGIAATPPSPGGYEVEAIRNGSTVAAGYIEAVDIIAGGDYHLTEALVGETNSYGGYLHSENGSVANFSFTLKAYTDYNHDNLLTETSVTTDDHGFFMIDYDIPADFNGDHLYLTAEATNDQKIGLERDDIWVNSPDSGGGSGVQLSVDTDSYENAPGEEIMIDVEATEDGNPIVDQSVDVFLRYEYDGPPLYSTTVTTDSQGKASTSTTIPADAPDGIDLDGAGGMEYNSSTYTSSIWAAIEKYNIDFNYPDISPGGSTEYSISVTNSSGDPVEGVSHQIDAVYGNGRAGSFGTAKLVSGTDGTDATTMQIPSDIGFDALANNLNRYWDEHIAAGTYPDHDGTLSTNDTHVAGEPSEFTFRVPNDVTFSGIVFSNNREARSNGKQFNVTGTQKTFSLTVPPGVDAGDYFGIEAWAVDDQGTKYSDSRWFQVDSGSIVVDASGETDVSSGGEATVSISAEVVDKLTIRQVWTDWELTATNPDGGTVTDNISSTGELTIEWDSVQSSVSPSVTLSLKSRYVGGTYRLDVTGSNTDGETAEATALITIA